jgi:carbon-monoxide dehydrogenase catalytic subunit
MIREGGLGQELADLPVAGAAPEAMSEKAVVIGFYCVASGVYVNYSPAMRVLGSSEVTKFLTEEMEELTGGKFSFVGDPVNAARLMIAHIDKKREALKLRPMMYAPVTPDIT